MACWVLLQTEKLKRVPSFRLFLNIPRMVSIHLIKEFSHILELSGKLWCDKDECLDHTKFPALHDNSGCNEDNSLRLQ